MYSNYCGEKGEGWGGGGARDVLALVNQGVPRACFRGERKKRKFCGFYLADYWHRERIIQFNSNGQLLWVNMKHSTQLRRIVETFFFICCYCQMFIFWLCFCNFLLSLGSLSSLKFDHFRPHLGFFFQLVSHENNKTTELCVESLTKRKHFWLFIQSQWKFLQKTPWGCQLKK